jgi:ABC-type transport system involved in multi-copper enzyme maturation permease subunit
MTFGQLVAIVGFEHDKLFARTTARLGLLVAGLLPLFAPLGIGAITAAASLFGADVTADATIYQRAALGLRHFTHLIHIVIVMLAALTMAGEFQQKSMRECLLRPVPRFVVPLAKWSALVSWVGTSVMLSWLSATIAGLIVYGSFEGEWLEAGAQHFGLFLADIGFAALALLIATLTRSVVMAMGVALGLTIADFVLWLGLLATSAIGSSAVSPQVGDWIEAIIPWQASNAFAVWIYYPDNLVWQSGASLAIITFGSLGATVAFFNWMDVP